MQQSLSISETRKNLPTLVKEVGSHGKFIPITVNGKAQAVLLGYEEFMSILETAKLTVSDAGNIQDHGTVQLLDREDVRVIGEPIPTDAQIEPPHSSHASYESFGSNDDQNNDQQEEHHEEHNEDHNEDNGNNWDQHGQHNNHNENGDNNNNQGEHHEENNWDNGNNTDANNEEHHNDANQNEEQHDEHNNGWNNDNNGDQNASDQNHHDY